MIYFKLAGTFFARQRFENRQNIMGTLTQQAQGVWPHSQKTAKSVPKHRNKRMAEVRDQAQKKQLPEVLKTQGFFMGVGKSKVFYICSLENGGNSFYIAPLSDTLADSPKSAHQPTHLGLIQRSVFRTFKRRSYRGIIRFDLHPQKWVSNCVEMGGEPLPLRQG